MHHNQIRQSWIVFPLRYSRDVRIKKMLPLHHFTRPLIHADHVALLGHGVEEGILPELHLIPEARAILAEEALEEVGAGGLGARARRRRHEGVARCSS